MPDKDPLVGFRYALELEGNIVGYCTEISGLGSKTETITQKVVDDKGRERILKLPGRTEWKDITIKTGMTQGNGIADWRKLVINGDKKARKHFSVKVYDAALQEVARYDVENAWPSEYSQGELKAGSNEVIIVTMTITHEGMEKVK